MLIVGRVLPEFRPGFEPHLLVDILGGRDVAHPIAALQLIGLGAEDERQRAVGNRLALQFGSQAPLDELFLRRVVFEDRLAVAYPVVEFLEELARRGLRRAVLTRNSRISTQATLARFEIEVHALHTRDDGPVKPNPSGIWRICEKWGFRPNECVMIGDYRFDIEAGRQAGTHTVLFVGGPKHSVLADHQRADFTLTSFAEPAAFWAWVEEKDGKKAEGKRQKAEG